MSRTEPARAARRIRAQILKDIREAPTGLLSRELCAEHLDAPHKALLTMRTHRLLGACRQVGDTYLRQLRLRTGVDLSRQLGTLTTRERDELRGALLERRDFEQHQQEEVSAA